MLGTVRCSDTVLGTVRCSDTMCWGQCGVLILYFGDSAVFWYGCWGQCGVSQIVQSGDEVQAT